MNSKKDLLFIPIAVMLLGGIFSVRAQTVTPTPGGINLTNGGYELNIWIDGNHSGPNANSYNIPWWGPAIPSPAPNAPNYYVEGGLNNTSVPALRNSKFNFQKEMYFGNVGASKLLSTQPYYLAPGNTYYVIVMSEVSMTGPLVSATLFSFNASAGAAAGTTTSLRWNNATANILNAYWTTTARNPGFTADNYLQYGVAAKNAQYGITTMIAQNILSSGGTLDLYLNGKQGTTIPGISTVTTATTNTQCYMVIGNGDGRINTAAGASYSTIPLDGSIQEIIVMRRASTAPPSSLAADLAKIHSYLAIKYGITLMTSYRNSSGGTVWNQTGYTNVFGIGRDDASGLYQKQSRSVNDSTLTIFLGSELKTLNDENTEMLPNGKYVMLGSKGDFGCVNYEYPAGTVFLNNSISKKINYYSRMIYRAQVKAFLDTDNPASPSSQPGMGIKVITPVDVRYLLVSNNLNGTFLSQDTRIYPVNEEGIATGVVINDDDYIAYAGFAATPGGVDMSKYHLDLWVDGNHSTNTTWSNLFPANFKLEKFSNFAPVLRNSKFNYHNELYFGNALSAKLRTSANYPLTAGTAYHLFVMSDATGIAGSGYVGTLLTFNNAYSNYSLRWMSSATANAGNILVSNWPGILRNPGFSSTDFPRYGIATMNLINTNRLDMYLNGSKQLSQALPFDISYTGTQPNQKILFGNASASATTGSAYPFNGSMQEIILMRGISAATMSAIDLAKIHSYLAIKYGVTLKSSYYDSDYGKTDISDPAATVWDFTANTGYNNHIFGVGRDDASGLYQKQAYSVSNSGLIAYLVNSSVETYNSENVGELYDKQFLMFGAGPGNPLAGIAPDTYQNDDEFVGGSKIKTTTGINIASRVYKTQLTGLTSMEIQLTAPSIDFTHVLVSTDPLFPAGLGGAAGYTKLYEIKLNHTVQIKVGLDGGEDYKWIKFIGFAPGPGGVNAGLRLWLRADDAATIETFPTSIEGENKTIGYSGPTESLAGNLSAVTKWSDFVRLQTFSYADGENNDNHYYPIMNYYSPEMNYWPSVRFFTNNGATRGAYLANRSTTLMPNNPNRKHTAFFMVNNDFGSSFGWIYMMGFGSSSLNSIVPRPGFGIEKSGSGPTAKMVGRFRTAGTELNGSVSLFNVGATSILRYSLVETGDRARFRFSGKEDQTIQILNINDINFAYVHPTTPGSTLGSAYAYNRTINGVMSEVILFDRELADYETRRVESYLAIKYGVTLFPEGVGHFTYLFSDSTVIWDGTIGKFDEYYRNVAAIIRDDDSRLQNQQSHSTDAGSLLHLGVAGSVLSAGGYESNVGSLENMEAIAFGCKDLPQIDPANRDTYFDRIIYTNCGDFTERFRRIWLIHKITKPALRPVTLLVGAQNNSGNPLGSNADSVTLDYYSRLTASYDVYMLVGDSAKDISGSNYNYKAVVPMEFVNGEYQCSYEFTNEDTYITFGCIETEKGCAGDPRGAFTGIKTFSWTSWTSRTNPTTTPAIPNNTTRWIPENPLLDDIGDSIRVKTQVQYAPGVRANRGYPRAVNVNSPTMGRSSLQVQRLGRTNTEVVTTIGFNYPVAPYFSISALDGASSSMEEVEIIGRCSGSDYVPRLTNVGNPSMARYRISGNKASINRTGNTSSTDKNGMVNVEFRGAVDTIQIKYRITGAATNSTRSIYISPIRMTGIMPPPPVNEAGLGFSKRASVYEFSTCEMNEVTYTFSIMNTNCENITIKNFSDTLPAYMSWETGTIFFLDSVSSKSNSNFNPEIPDAEGRILEIKELIIPAGRTLQLRATALLDEDNITSGDYANRAYFTYELIKGGVPTTQPAYSTDYFYSNTGVQATVVKVVKGQPAAGIDVRDKYSATTYKENDEIEVTYTFNNPNDSIHESFLDIYFNEEFQYKPGSFIMTMNTDTIRTPTSNQPRAYSDDRGMLNIAGYNAPGTPTNPLIIENGFTLPPGETVVKFTLTAPKTSTVNQNDINALQPQYDINGAIIPGRVADMVISYSLNSTIDDMCLLKAIPDEGTQSLPYSRGKAKVITNKNVTGKIPR